MNIEQEVREMLNAKVQKAPGMNEPPQPVLRRARNRRILNGSGIAVAVVLIAAGSVVGGRSLLADRTIAPDAQGSGRVVPWAPHTYNPPGTNACRASDLSFSIKGGQTPSLSFRTVGSDELNCVIGQGMRLTVIDPGNPGLTVVVRQAEPKADFIVQGSRLETNWHFGWANGCAPSDHLRFVMTLPDRGGTLSTDASDLKGTVCIGESRAELTLNGYGTQPYGPIGSMRELTYRFALVPRSFGAGETITYRILLTNDTSRLIPLDPCPAFFQTLTIGDREQQEWHTLNCGAAPAGIRPGKSLTFEMQIKPEGTTSGAGSLQWFLLGKSDSIPIRAPILAR
jgi:hypothetical protein